MKIYSIKELFELRQTSSLRPRTCFARFFLKDNLPGFMDVSGAVWPVRFLDESLSVGLEFGCVYRITSCGTDPAFQTKMQSQAVDDFLVIREVEKNSGQGNSGWPLAMIPDPGHFHLPTFLSNSGCFSVFFQTNTSKRQAILFKRSRVISDIRRFFSGMCYLELDPPVLVLSGGVERYLNMFCTDYVDHRGLRWQMQLPTSPEISLKKIVTEGTPRLFAVSHAFRNQGELSAHHDPEFMMLEWYRISDDFESLLVETQKVVELVSRSLGITNALPEKSWDRFKVKDLFKGILGMDLQELDDVDLFRAQASKQSLSIVTTDTWDDVFCKLFMEFIEPYLKEQKACFVTHYPARMGALASLSREDSGYVDRFELYLNGVEICNGYRELIDSSEFLRRLERVLLERSNLVRDPLFEGCFLKGIYPCVGNALGLDRLISVLLGVSSIQDILPWPFASRFSLKTIALE